MATKVHLVLARQKFEGPWKGLSVHVRKAEANQEAKSQKMMWDEIKVLTVFDYEAAQYLQASDSA